MSENTLIDVHGGLRAQAGDTHVDYGEDVKYPYASTEEGQIVHIRSVTKEEAKQHKYECPCCHTRLRPRLGLRNRHCFYHDNGTRCSIDNYIHETAKKILYDRFKKDGPFYIVLGMDRRCEAIESCLFRHNSCSSKNIGRFNLKIAYDTCTLEKRIGEFRADLLLEDSTGKHDPILIEIWSKHRNSEKKSSSRYKIIEIRLKSLDDLENLCTSDIEEGENVTFTNFKSVICRKASEFPNARLRKTVLYASGKTYDGDKCSCTTYQGQRHKTAVAELITDEDTMTSANDRQLFLQLLAIDNGINCRNCHMCRNLEGITINEDEYTFSCRLGRIPEGRSFEYAMECTEFKDKEKYHRDIRMEMSFHTTILRLKKDGIWTETPYTNSSLLYY